jgi:hypothetical protein
MLLGFHHVFHLIQLKVWLPVAEASSCSTAMKSKGEADHATSPLHQEHKQFFGETAIY